MIILSNNLQGKLPIPKDAVIRLNLAWIKDIQNAKKIIEDSKHPIYLDYPSGRTKPPVPTMSIHEIIPFTFYNSVEYFAVSNAEDIKYIKKLKYDIGCELVPKVETIKGVKIIGKMIKAGIKKIMLDKEDLYTNCGCDSKVYNKYLKKARRYKDKIQILELQGVIFQ